MTLTLVNMTAAPWHEGAMIELPGVDSRGRKPLLRHSLQRIMKNASRLPSVARRLLASQLIRDKGAENLRSVGSSNLEGTG